MKTLIALIALLASATVTALAVPINCPSIGDVSSLQNDTVILTTLDTLIPNFATPLSGQPAVFSNAIENFLGAPLGTLDHLDQVRGLADPSQIYSVTTVGSAIHFQLALSKPQTLSFQWNILANGQGRGAGSPLGNVIDFSFITIDDSAQMLSDVRLSTLPMAAASFLRTAHSTLRSRMRAAFTLRAFRSELALTTSASASSKCTTR